MKQISLLLGAILTIASFAAGQEPAATVSPTPTPAPAGETRTTINSGPGNPNLPIPKRPDLIFKIAGNQNGYTRPDAETRRKRFLNSLVGPWALGRTVVNAGLSTWSNSPEEWGTKWEGFGRRVASTFGKKAIKQTTTFGLDEAFKLDSKFYRSRNKSVGARVKNALISPVTARDKDGRRVFGFPRIAGTYASSIIAYETWYPDRYGWKNGVRSGTISLGFNAAFNLFKEFVWKK